MADQTRRNGNMAVIATMFALFFMIAFVTNLAGSMGVIVKEQFKASNTLSQLGSAANFLAYLFMGIPGGLVLRRKGYKFTSLVAVAIGFGGVAVQLLSGYVGSFLVYVLGAFVAGTVVGAYWFCMMVGGVCLPLQGLIADKVGILNSYWLTVALLAYLLLYAQVLSNPSSGCGSAGNR